MKCAVCKRDLAPTLSICTSCGAMMNDTVRQELEAKVGRVSGSLAVAATESGPLAAAGVLQIDRPRIPAVPAAAPAQPKPQLSKPSTNNLSKKTSKTLVEFQSKNATVPDWRLQLQNSVRQRANGFSRESAPSSEDQTTYKKRLVTSGANALKAEAVEETAAAIHENTRVANALKRIEESRRTFLSQYPKAAANVGAALKAGRSFPFNVVSRSGDIAPKSTTAGVQTITKPRLVSSLRIEKRRYDTNKLPPIPSPAQLSTSFDLPAAASEPVEKKREEESERINITAQTVEPEIVETEVVETDEIDDLAPFSMRFGAGVFDLIIGGFASALILSPFMFTGGSWLTFYGIMAIIAGFAIGMFVYLTASIGFFGRTFGMRLFSLELIDIEENAYPTLHQAAVSSSVYLLSLAVFGIGFLPAFFNEERRAAHDLVSGTILVREF